MGTSKADSLKEGPLKASFKMKGEFKLSEGAGGGGGLWIMGPSSSLCRRTESGGGHWEVLPKAVSDVKLVFGRGGIVQGKASNPETCSLVVLETLSQGSQVR